MPLVRLSRLAFGTLLAAAIAGSVSAASPAPLQATVAVEDFAFTPPIVTVAVGGSVTWQARKDPEQHTVTPVEPGSFDGSDPLFEGDDFTLTFDGPGRFDYVCSFHPFMTGTVQVVAAPVVASPSTSVAPPTSTDAARPSASVPPIAGEPADRSVAAVPAIVGLLALVGVVLLWWVLSRRRSERS